MKITLYNILGTAALLAGAMTAASCTDYLDKAPGSDIDEVEPYKNYRNFQGFVEEMYGGLPAVTGNDYHTSWNLGEDEYWEPSDTRPLAYHIDNGDFRCIVNDGEYFYGFPRNGNGDPESDDQHNKGNIWKLSWKCIRKANIGLDNLNLLQDATQEEKDIIKGQLLFFRGFYHFMLMQYWGGLPYIDHVLPAGETPSLPRLNYHDTAEKAAADLAEAAKLLPIDWDETTVGRLTLGNNNMRANKIMALAYQGKTLLYAGSPLMNYESTGVRDYNADLCKRAAEALGEALSLTESTGRYQLADFSEWNDLFYMAQRGNRVPGLKEAILQENITNLLGRSMWNQRNDYFPQNIVSSGVKAQPAANYVQYYGMKNGLPIADIATADPATGYDPQYPWRDRDPRFYKDFAYDGVQTVKDDSGKYEEEDRYASLYSKGKYRTASGAKSNLTGFILTKFIRQYALDKGTYNDYEITMSVSLMRLADVYLMYAEAVAQGYGTPASKATNFTMTAVEAVNKIRQRAGVADVAAQYTGSKDAFMSELRRERAVELGFEGHRFNDLRRWLLLTERPYTLKTRLEFDRTAGINFKEPSQSRVANLREEVILERKLEERHYWLPLPNADVNLYPEFGQNPGW